MQALVYHKPKDVRVEERPDPRIEEPRDAVLRVTTTAICGSDLHIYNGMIPQLRDMVLGHEFVGEVEQVGPDAGLSVGDRVLVPFPIADGTCWFCQRGMPVHCENSNPLYGPEGALMKGKGAALFGYTDMYGGKDGGQAEQVRVPYADNGPRRIPDEISDEEAVMLTDVVPTAWTANEWGDVQEGDTVAVFGCGPVGLMAQRIALFRGAGEVLAVDQVPERLRMAQRIGSTPIAAEDPDEAVRERTDGRGADVAIDAVGMEAERRPIIGAVKQVVHMERGTINALRHVFGSVRRGGRVAVMGVYPMSYDNFPLGQVFDKGLRIQGGQAPVHAVVDGLLEHVREGRLKASDIITHRMPLEQAPEAYKMFCDKEDGCIKAVLNP